MYFCALSRLFYVVSGEIISMSVHDCVESAQVLVPGRSNP